MSASPTDHQPRQPPAPPTALPVYLLEHLMLVTSPKKGFHIKTVSISGFP